MTRLTTRDIRKQQVAASSCICEACAKLRASLGITPAPAAPAPEGK